MIQSSDIWRQGLPKKKKYAGCVDSEVIFGRSRNSWGTFSVHLNTKKYRVIYDWHYIYVLFFLIQLLRHIVFSYYFAH